MALLQLPKQTDEDLSATAVVFDFDKVLANVPGAGHSGTHNPNRIRGGLDTVQTLAMLQARKVPLFIATARSTPALLQDLIAKLGKSCSGNEQSLLKYFIESGSDVAHRGTRVTAPPPVPSRGTPVLDPNQGVGAAAVAAAAAPEEPLSDAAARLLGEDPIVINELRNDPLRVTIKRVEGTRVFSAGYDKAKLVAHLITHEIEPERRRIIFVDDNVFHAYFVLQESPGHVHAQQPQRQCTVVSSWWDPSEEQSRGQMMVINDSDFSYTKAYQECLSAFGVDEPERVRTAGILLAKALLRGES
ncbi:Hypothetical Protein FCC1311_001772 [Hondaea fermentalgiana]|uniref:Uncharacterized protein n=1 Tax=Hondaea fermentalgiana TaxID=2315210 RepID=A0A2R5G2K3_9STRA|nr:Hypothetical Protein FCC1311_001772 [Hondaea fermentalgiana]|eukprot:GBG23958.1 Hypothetical Protein FCC1311_001772 [Hondaea fermentalgiana]